LGNCLSLLEIGVGEVENAILAPGEGVGVVFLPVIFERANIAYFT
jgi:hypothetical protein